MTEEHEFDFEELIRVKGKCCVCDTDLFNSKHINVVQLDKIATWKYPVWGNIHYKIPTDGAAAIICDDCVDSGRFTHELKSAIEFNQKAGDIIYHPIADLKDKVYTILVEHREERFVEMTYDIMGEGQEL